MNKLLDSISSGLLAEYESTSRDLDMGDPETYTSHRSALEMYAFLLMWFVGVAEKVKARSDDVDAAVVAPKSRRGRGGKVANSRTAGKKDSQWSWSNQIQPTLALISRVLRLKTHRIWTTTADRDAFIKYVLVSYGLYRLANEFFQLLDQARIPNQRVRNAHEV